MTVAEMAPVSEFVTNLRGLARKIRAFDPSTVSLPTPLTDEEFRSAVRSRFHFDGNAAEDELMSEETPESEVTREDSESCQNEILAGKRAVAAGLVSAEEALRRLREHYPKTAANVVQADLAS